MRHAKPELMRGSMLRLEGATVRFGGRAVLDSVGLDVAEHEIVSVLGPSGSGKSTLLRAVAGLQPLDEGRVFLDGRDLHGVPAHKRGVGLMFQDHQLFPQRDVGGNVAFGLRMHGESKDQQAVRVRELLDLVGLPGARERAVASLSGGEQQRVALARALAPRPGCSCSTNPSASWTARCVSGWWSNSASCSASWAPPCSRSPTTRGGVRARRPGRRDAGRPDRPVRYAT